MKAADPLPIAGISIVLVASLLATGCIGVSAKRHGAGGPGTAPIKVCRAAKPALDGILDDFEDSNTQLTMKAARDGYWWSASDDMGSTKDMLVDEGGADSDLAMHFSGTTVPGSAEAGQWGAQVGANFLAQNGTPYDASRYAGIRFKAKVGKGAARRVRFKIGDINTHKDGGICTTCWNLWGKDFLLTEEWREYTIPFAGAEQEPGWGNPRPPSMLPDKLLAFNVSIGAGQTYDLWLDDLTFVDCQ